MKSCLFPLFLLLSGLLFPFSGGAAAAAADEWQFEITPYIWAAGIEGDISTGGGTPVSSPVENDYSFFAMENLDLAGFLAFEARKGRWHVLSDGLYVDYSDAFTNGPVTTDLEVEGVILEGALGYHLSQIEQLIVLAGGRYFSIRNNIDLTPGPSGSDRVDWADPFIGARVSHDINSTWHASLRGDIGGFGVSSELMYNVVVTLGYRFNDDFDLKIGYRYLYADFDKDLFKYDASLSGFGVGLGIRF